MGAFTGGECEVDLAPLVAEHKFVAFYFTTPGSTPCLVWDSVIKQLLKEVNSEQPQLLCVLIPVSIVDFENVSITDQIMQD